eukprot:TRINITY_DN53874_c0_g1_i1.p1 TRINITY_DN53874_c0_g1~~TRINITY_DN53874_c0_g1_i1.p1  ORF type:complete len:965 (+),score=292.98 TRINITY_DN53874_c0_g1_i1:89-2896(+)
MAQEPDFGDVADVTHSTAFLTLDGLVDHKKIVEERAFYLKEKYKQLHDRVLTIYNNDNFLLKRAKLIRKDLDNEKARVEKCGEVAKDDDATIQKLKRELALAENELSVAQEKESMLQVETIELERKKTALQNEVDDALAEEESRMRPTIDAITNGVKDLKGEIEATARKFDQYKVEREETIKREQQLKELMDAQDVQIYERKLLLTKLDREPDRARKQADIVEKATATAQKELNTLMDKLNLLNQTIKDHEERRKNMEEQRYELALTLETQRTAIEQREKMMDTIARNLESEKEANFKLVQSSTSLEASLKNMAMDSGKAKEQLGKVLKDKETGLKTFRRIEQLQRELTSDRDTLIKQREIMQREIARIKTTRKKLQEELEELKRDVDILINNFLKEEINEKAQGEELYALLKLIKTSEALVVTKAEEEGNNSRLINELSTHRENKSREASKNKAKVAAAKDDLKVKEVVVKELNKRNNELLVRLQSLTEMYSVVKRERSNKAALIQSASQAMSETQEKIKILDNELEVLRRESLAKDKALIKVRRELHDERTNCENLRIEANKLYATYKSKKKHIQEQCSQINKLNTVINMTEEEMLQLKKKYEDAVEDRNFTGIQLIDRNDELCILYEKCNIQESILKNGQLELKTKEEEIRSLAIQLSDIQREIELCQRLLPKVKEHEEELMSLREQLDEEKWNAETLEEALVDPKNTSRWRKLGPVKKGVEPDDQDESAESLRAKEQELEQKLYQQHEKLMEKDLILEEVTELSDRLRKHATNGREYTLELAKKVNSYQHTIQQKAKKMMATLSELSMVQASSMKLQNDLMESQQHVEEAKKRLEDGLAPTEDAEQTFYRHERDRRRREQELVVQQLRRQQEEEQPAQIMRTTAEVRPNAYIPNPEIMLPKPYGALQPFKSTTSANAYKFWRKPELAPVQL